MDRTGETLVLPTASMSKNGNFEKFKAPEIFGTVCYCSLELFVTAASKTCPD